ncbi:venom protease-like isoform X1 [Diabrotica virgifera virgifera]|uniref:Peptidase S1 domain-containing protein n=1 Tax=Diabrotica virgifera virgifera TaxID=50390 RepID=A0ABM5JGW3_DIAVI|nr:venom protease-like isoform X1 [Diabrotica virgifera virgifera]
MKHKLIFLFVYFVFYNDVYAQVGDRCTFKGTTKRGVCKEITKCPAAEEQAKQGTDDVTLCGFANDLNTAIVCCEVTVEPNDNLLPADFDTNGETSPPGKMSERKCQEYSKAITSEVQFLSLVSDATPMSYRTPKCDYNTVPLIVGGTPAEAGEFPFMVAIGFNTTSDRWRCGGTLISTRFVVTAAHCCYTRDAGKPSVVRVGELDLASDQDGSVYADYLISRVIVHPGYSAPYKYNDIALLETQQPVVFTNFTRPACLNLNHNVAQSQAIATGWGKTDFAGDASDRLLKVTLNLYDNQRCQRTFPPNNKELPRGIESTMLCAGHLEGGKDTCYGDSGGPLVVTKKGNMCQFFLVGVTSFGKLCGQKNTPAIYTRVSEYIPWIERIVWKS